MAAVLLAPPEFRPDVLPSARLGRTGKAVPEVRAGLRRIPVATNVVAVGAAYLESLGVIAAAVAINRWWAYALAFVLMSRAFALYGILGHEATHRLLFPNRAVNDGLGRWLLAYPSFTAFDAYRRAHLAHHRDEMGPDEPDLGLYRGYPISRASFRRKLTRDALGISGWKNLKPLGKALWHRSSFRVAASIVAVQSVVFAGLWAASGRWWLYPLLWLLPWLTGWRVINRLRAIAEHGGMTRSDDKRLTTHVVRQRLLARFWLVPFNTGWHLAHHLDIGIPWRNLPRYHAELVEAGYVTSGIEYPSYLALWRKLASA
jgi:fatty acid desaturase